MRQQCVSGARGYSIRFDPTSTFLCTAFSSVSENRVHRLIDCKLDLLNQLPTDLRKLAFAQLAIAPQLLAK